MNSMKNGLFRVGGVGREIFFTGGLVVEVGFEPLDIFTTGGFAFFSVPAGGRTFFEALTFSSSVED